MPSPSEDFLAELEQQEDKTPYYYFQLPINKEKLERMSQGQGIDIEITPREVLQFFFRDGWHTFDTQDRRKTSTYQLKRTVHGVLDLRPNQRPYDALLQRLSEKDMSDVCSYLQVPTIREKLELMSQGEAQRIKIKQRKALELFIDESWYTAHSTEETEGKWYNIVRISQNEFILLGDPVCGEHKSLQDVWSSPGVVGEGKDKKVFSVPRIDVDGNFVVLISKHFIGDPPDPGVIKEIDGMQRAAKVSQVLTNYCKHFSSICSTFSTVQEGANTHYLFQFDRQAEETLSNALKKGRIGGLGSDGKLLSANQALAQLLSAVKIMRMFGLGHGDLKPLNVLVDNGVLKITDFDTGKFRGDSVDTGDISGSPQYLPPETLLLSGYQKGRRLRNLTGIQQQQKQRLEDTLRSEAQEQGVLYETLVNQIIDRRKADIYALGIIYYQLLHGKPGIFPSRWPMGTNKYKNKKQVMLLNAMLEPDPRKRLGPEKLLKFMEENNMLGKPEPEPEPEPESEPKPKVAKKPRRRRQQTSRTGRTDRDAKRNMDMNMETYTVDLMIRLHNSVVGLQALHSKYNFNSVYLTSTKSILTEIGRGFSADSGLERGKHQMNYQIGYYAGLLDTFIGYLCLALEHEQAHQLPRRRVFRKESWQQKRSQQVAEVIAVLRPERKKHQQGNTEGESLKTFYTQKLPSPRVDSKVGTQVIRSVEEMHAHLRALCDRFGFENNNQQSRLNGYDTWTSIGAPSAAGSQATQPSANIDAPRLGSINS